MEILIFFQVIMLLLLNKYTYYTQGANEKICTNYWLKSMTTVEA